MAGSLSSVRRPQGTGGMFLHPSAMHEKRQTDAADAAKRPPTGVRAREVARALYVYVLTD